MVQEVHIPLLLKVYLIWGLLGPQSLHGWWNLTLGSFLAHWLEGCFFLKSFWTHSPFFSLQFVVVEENLLFCRVFLSVDFSGHIPVVAFGMLFGTFIISYELVVRSRVVVLNHGWFCPLETIWQYLENFLYCHNLQGGTNISWVEAADAA